MHLFELITHMLVWGLTGDSVTQLRKPQKPLYWSTLLTFQLAKTWKFSNLLPVRQGEAGGLLSCWCENKMVQLSQKENQQYLTKTHVFALWPSNPTARNLPGDITPHHPKHANICTKGQLKQSKEKQGPKRWLMPAALSEYWDSSCPSAHMVAHNCL